MNASVEHLAIFAEVSAALVGFVALFLVLVRREERFPPEDGLRIRVMILIGFTGVAMSLLPIVIAQNTFDEATIWRSSSIIFLSISAAQACYVAVRHFQLPISSRMNIPRWNLLLAWGFVMVAMLLLLGNVGSTNLFAPSFAYTAAILLTLGAGATNFFTIAIQKLL